MQKTYIKYLNQGKSTNSQCHKIRTHALGIEQNLDISNKERKKPLTFLEE